MHLRRALLLFAIVLGLTAVAAALSTPPQQRQAEPRRADRPPPRIGSGFKAPTGIEPVYAALQAAA